MQSPVRNYNISYDKDNNLTVIPVGKKPTYTLIFIHGLGMSPTEFLKFLIEDPIAESLQNFKIVLPQAPVRNLTYSGAKLISWFDIKTYEKSFDRPFNEAFSAEEIKESEQIIERFVQQELKELNGDASKLFIGGFSQGCAMSLHCAHTLNVEFGGVVSIAGYLFEISKYNKEKENKMPTLIIHGLADKRRPWDEVQKCYQRQPVSENIIKTVEGMGHDLNSKECKQLVAQFFKQYAKL